MRTIEFSNKFQKKGESSWNFGKTSRVIPHHQRENKNTVRWRLKILRRRNYLGVTSKPVKTLCLTDERKYLLPKRHQTQ